MTARAAGSPILQFLRRVVEDPRVRELPDRDLLLRYHSQRDEAAFDSLLRRHGPMVLDVCRGVLGDGSDAEDAFQATFLVLAHKAGSIRKGTALGSWLHGVARRTALKALARSTTRQKHEARAPARPDASADDLDWREVRQVLHDELAGLPERYREALVLCYLEGETQPRAAARLGLGERTLRERLERGRELLRARLARRGLGPPAVLLAAAWPAAFSPAHLPAALVAGTVEGVTLIATGQGLAGAASSSDVIALSKEVLETMIVGKVKHLAVVLLGLVCGVACVGAVVLEPAPSAGPGLASASELATAEPAPVAGFVADEEPPVPLKTKPGVGPGSGSGVGDGATPIDVGPPATPAKVKPGVGPGGGIGGPTPAKSLPGAGKTKGPAVPAKVKPGVGPGGGFVADEEPVGPVKTKPGVGPGFGFGTGERATPIDP